MRLNYRILKAGALPVNAAIGALGAASAGLSASRDRLEEQKLRTLIWLNRRRGAVDRQYLDVYWDPDFAESSEHWAEDTAWQELPFFLVNCRGRVLDIACGSGRTIQLMQRFTSCDFHGCDISDALIRWAIEKRGMDPARLTVCDATQLPYEDDWFDYAYSVGSLEHFTEEGITRVLQECHRTTRFTSFHQVPVSRKDKDEGWIMPNQAYHLKPVQWWGAKCRDVYDEVHVFPSTWADPISIGVWLVCVKGQR